ncbi:formate dehydrogenase subunit alpha [Xanthobacter autotrophicus]|uniref:formate dehydrogenase subunit alpha n=1 Tax=Xanthobacter autotrophicus TaxID=280 RepID=UPI0024AB1E80|nr:formate dehydrogenase subunit alpha [Xanthobacter autotrophicus]MDI4666123.1 formate dehydrogenase subunit alpha [Xanthobacter autotrophicus]
MSLVHEIDYGTPASKSQKLVTLTIDGMSVTVPEGTSIMRAAMELGNQIPKLCATDMLESFGSCRLCLIEIEGRNGTPASCTTPVQEGIVVKTQTERLKQIRKGVMELYISDHPLDCLTCSANGDCELQDMAGVVGLRDVRYGYEGENHTRLGKDESNPYFTYEQSKCIVCNRCVRACEEVQGTFALTISGRGFDSRVSPGMDEPFLTSECVSCGACVQACPTATLNEKAMYDIGTPEHSVVTTCAYCGVGCTFKAEMRGDELVRMVPYKDGKANRGHSCVKGRFAYGYATHQDRILKPMIRSSIHEPWTEVTYEEAIAYAASEFKRIQEKYGKRAVGGITSSRCTNEETYLVQKLIRGGFGNNNVDTCARVCHSPTGYGLSQTYGTSAGTQDFDSVEETDVVLIIGANPTDGHPVFGSRLKKRLREGAKLIVVDPRRTDIVRSPHVEASYHLPLKPGTNVAIVTALAHVIVTEGLVDEKFVRERCDWDEFQDWAAFVADERHSPEAVEKYTGVDPALVRGAARLYATGGNGSIYYGLGVTEHSQGSTTVMAIANLAMATGNVGRNGVGVNPLRGQNNVQGSCDMGSFPHELPGYRHISDDATRATFESLWGVPLDDEPGLRIPNMFDAAVDGTFKGLYVQGEDILQSDPDTKHVSAGLAGLECLIVQDLFLNETANYAHVFLPGCSFLEKDGTFTNAERRIQRIRKVMAPKNGYADWEVTQLFANALGFPMTYTHPSQIMDEIAALTPTFAGVNYAKLDELGSVQWPCNDEAPEGTPIMHIGGFVRGKGKFVLTEYVPTDEKTGPRFPLLLTTGRILSQYNVGAQTRRTANVAWHPEDVLEIHAHDAENRGIRDGDFVKLDSRAGSTSLRAVISDRVAPGVVYTTFHHPVTQANVVTTDYSDWATNCPEYKVTAVQVSPSNGPTQWQEDYETLSRTSRRIAAEAAGGAREGLWLLYTSPSPRDCS